MGPRPEPSANHRRNEKKSKTQSRTVLYHQEEDPKKTDPLRDVTERVQTERALHESSEAASHLAAIVESSDDAIMSITLDGVITSWNRGAEKLYGYSSNETIGKSFYILVGPSHRDDIDQALERVKNGEAIHNYRTQRIRKDGTTVEVSLTLSTIKDSAGAIIGSSSIARDITERKKMEEALRDSEARYRKYFDLGLVGMALETPSGGWVDANSRLCEIFGYTRQELFKKHWTELTHPDDIAKDTEQLGKLLRGEIERYSIEKRFIRKDGKVIDAIIAINSTRDQNGKTNLLFGFVIDITERKKMEEANSRLAAIVESSDDAIIGKTLDGIITSWNRGAEKLYGYSAEEVKGRSISILIPSDQTDELKQVLAKIRQGELVQHYETRRKRKDGTIIDVSLTVSPVKDRAGRIVGASAITRDITDRKKVEQPLRESEDKYRAIVENSSDMISIAQDGVLKYVNETMCERLGWTPDELLSPDFRFQEKIIAPESRELIAQNLARRLKGETIPPYEANHITRDGTAFPTVVRAKRISYLGKPADAVTVTDITERKKMENEVHAASLYARGLIEASLDPLVTISREGKITDVNEATERATGVPRAKLIGRDFAEYFTEPEKARDGYRQVFSKGFVRDYPLAIRNASGAIMDVLYNATVYRNEAGQIAGVFAAARDITDRKQAEDQLKRYSLTLEEKVDERTRELQLAKVQVEYATVFNPAVVGISKPTLDKSDFHASFISKSARSVLGFEPEELVGESGAKFWESRIPAEDLRKFRAEVPLLWRDGRHKFEYRFLHGDGGTRWIREEQRVARDSDGNVQDIVGFWNDITEEKRLEEELREGEERYRIVADNTYDWEFWRTTDGRLIYCSPSCKRITGHTREEFVADPGLLNRIVHPEDQAMFVKHQDLVYGQRTSETIQFRIITPEGEVKWIEHACQPVFGENAEFRGIRASNRDATLRVQAETLEDKRKAEVAKKLNDITDRLDSLAKTREKLKTVPDVSTGLDTALETVLWNFGLDSGAVLAVDRKANTVNVRAAKARLKELSLNQSYPLGEVKELEELEAKSVTRTLGGDEMSILGTRIIHIIPIRAATETYGALILGNEEENSVDEQDLRILEQYAELVYAFMIERSISLTPVLEAKPERGISGLASSIESGEMYLFKRNPSDAFEVFTNTVFAGHQGLCVTRMYPPKVRSKYGIEKTPIVWLTNEATEGEQCMYSLQDLSIVIGDYLAKAEKAVVLIDGCEYLITNHGFDAFLRFLQILKNRVQRLNGILIASVVEQTLAPRELALIEREMRLFGR